MNIGLFTESYLPQVNGVVNFIQLLKRGLEQKGHTVHIFAPRVSGYTDRELNVHRFPMFCSFHLIEKLLGFELNWRVPLPFLRRYRDILSSLDVFHTHHMFVLGMFSASFGRRRKIPIIFTNHTNYREFEALLPVQCVFSFIFRCWFYFVSRLSTCVISPGERMRRQLRDYGVKKEIVVIPNAVELKRFAPPDGQEIESLRARWGIKKEDRVLVYIGRLSREKNLLFLLKSLKGLLADTDDLKLLLVGDGRSKATLERVARAMDLDDRIIFTGYIPYGEIHNYYFLGDLFVTASLSEVFPLTIIEALSSSLPVVAIDAVGTGDIIRDGYNGILVQESAEAFQEGVRSIIADEGLRRRMGANGREFVERLSFEHCIEKHIALYRRHSDSRRCGGGAVLSAVGRG
jgi:1,2-diacylglycerol 3-alpha-glucosyltransferase